MKTKELATWLGLSTAAIRTWTLSDEFKPFLSPTAQGGDGSRRNFTPMDARVVAHISRLKNQQYSPEEIVTALQALEADNWRDLPPMPQAPPGVEIDFMPREAAETALVQQRNALLREISMLQERIDDLETDLTDERRRYLDAIQRHAAEIAAERDKQDVLQTQLLDAREQLGELRGRLEEISKDHSAQLSSLASERRLWLRAVVAVAVVAAVLLAVILLLALAAGGVAG